MQTKRMEDACEGDVDGAGLRVIERFPKDHQRDARGESGQIEEGAVGDDIEGEAERETAPEDRAEKPQVRVAQMPQHNKSGCSGNDGKERAYDSDAGWPERQAGVQEQSQ